MFSERLENLIKAALQDGVLTDKEKASIIKRAQAEGEDIDEVEIYIQSLMQKRQQELNKKDKEERAIQNEAIAQEEKKRSKMLRKCPKCGIEIPHLTVVCPECGFIIDKSSVDEKIVIIKSLLSDYINERPFLTHRNEILYLTDRKKIPQEQYEMLSNCFKSSRKTGKGFVTVEGNLRGIKEEASLYREYEEINSLLNQLAKKEARLYYDKALDDLKPNDKGINQAKTRLSILQNRYADIANDEIVSLEGKILEAEEFKNSMRGKITRLIKRHLWWIITILIVLSFYVKCRNSSPEVISDNVIELVQENKPMEAKTIVTSSKISKGTFDTFGRDFVEDYDAMFLALIKAYVKIGDYENAETVALAYRSKIDEYIWDETPTYKYLKSLYGQEGRDFSSLREIN